MNVYDFDKTIYRGDSTTHFFFYCLGHYPGCWKTVPRTMFYGAGYLAKVCKKEKFKGIFYSFLNSVDDVDQAVLNFWESHETNVQKWYLDQKEDTDLIISASPAFLLTPVAERLGVSLIASEVDKKSGKLLGANNSNAAKVDRFKEKYDTDDIEEFYSDSDNDLPMARLAKSAFKVKRGKVSPWNL